MSTKDTELAPSPLVGEGWGEEEAAPQRIGILGGTFDPPHLGHLLIAEMARVALQLESVLFVPTGEPWLKSGQRITPAAHRLRMVELAVADNPHFHVCDCEIRRSGATYTVDTLRELRGAYPDDAELYFIVGSDVLCQFHRWQEPDAILSLCRLAVIERPGVPADGVATLARTFQAAVANGAVVSVAGPRVDFSASELRRILAAGQSARYQIPDAVAQYIREHDLYRTEWSGNDD